ncbi:MAG: M20/M25/M40 family metallo-hydrolase, partial [Planktomarina sp.]
GGPLNIVPNHCELDFEIRNLAQDDPVAILDRLKDQAADLVAQARIIAPEADITFDIFNTYPGLNTDLGEQVVGFVKSLTGANGTCKVAFGTEGGLFDQRLGIPTVVCGPGSMDQGHKPDEYVTLDQLGQCDVMLDNLVTRLKGGI